MENKIDYLRLSITDRCNLNCMYCTPLQKNQFLTHDEVLRYEEMAKAVRLFVSLGIRKLRITGGEPLIKKGFVDIIRMMKKIDGLEEVSLTTNGVFLKDSVEKLKNAGLDRINISLDTLKKEKFHAITGSDLFDDVWEGVMKSLESNLHPVKLNVVLIKGVNDDEILDFAGLTYRYPLSVRFIEFFPTNERSQKLAQCFVGNEEVRKKISRYFGNMKPAPATKGNGPAENYQPFGAKGTVGFISHFTRNFCFSCNRLRMDCSGRISPCLFSGYMYNIGPLIKNGASDKQLFNYINEIMNGKCNYKKETRRNPMIEMSSVGG